mgnify:CR=1 FL=1
MIERVTVTTGSRLHFGPLAVRPTTGREFGGIGLMVDAPRCRVTVSRSETDEVIASTESARVAGWLQRYRNATRQAAAGRRIELSESIPRHSGFGSGTQTALAVATGLALLDGEANVASDELARRLGRGRRSAVGIHGFEQGGFLVDAGKRERDAVGELTCRMGFPEGWRFVLITPGSGTSMTGQSEQTAFERLSPMQAARTDRLCGIVVREILPALRAADLEAFNLGVEAYGRIVGEYFAAAQGGVFADKRGERLAAAGVRGVVQTSWGPTLCVCRQDVDSATTLSESLQGDREWRDCGVRVVRGMNCGAEANARRR